VVALRVDASGPALEHLLDREQVPLGLLDRVRHDLHVGAAPQVHLPRGVDGDHRVGRPVLHLEHEESEVGAEDDDVRLLSADARLVPDVVLVGQRFAEPLVGELLATVRLGEPILDCVAVGHSTTPLESGRLP